MNNKFIHVNSGGKTDLAGTIRANALSSLYWFSYFVLGYEDMRPELHLPFANFLQLHPWNGGPPDSMRKMAWMPRGHFKSSLASVALPLWLLCHDRNMTIALFSAKMDHPVKWLRQIKTIINSNKWFKLAFPEIKPMPANERPGYEKWDQHEIIITREPVLSGDAQATITCASIASGQASQHWDYIIVDDPVNEKTAKSEDEIARAVDTYKYMDALGRGFARTGHLLVGTPYGRGDVMEWAMENQVKSGNRLYWGIGARGDFEISEKLRGQRDLLVNLEPGAPILPNIVPESMLQKIENEDIEKYYLQYLCKPYDLGRNGFDLDLIRDYWKDQSLTFHCECHPRHSHNISNMSLIGLCDPASSPDKEACKSAIVVVAKGECGCRFIVEEWAQRVDPSVTTNQIIDVTKRWQPYLRNFGIETVGLQVTLKSWLEQLQAEGKLPIQVKFHPLKPAGRKKDARISSQLGPVRAGLWHKLPTMRLTEGRENLLWELSKWPLNKQRDLIDASFGYCDDIWSLPEADPGLQYEKHGPDQNDLHERYMKGSRALI